MIRWILISAAGLSLLAGCARYEARPITATESAAALRGRTLDDATLAQAGARLDDARLFSFVNTDIRLDDGLTVDEAFLAALAHSPRLETLRALVREREGLIVHAGALPPVSWDGMTVNDAGRWQGETNAKVDLFSLMDLFKRPARRARAGAEHEVARLQVLDAELGLYFDLDAGLAELAVMRAYRQDIAALLQQLNTDIGHRAELAARMGRIAQSDLAGITVSRVRLETRSQTLNTRIARAEEDLLKTIGLAPEAALEFQTPTAVDPDAWSLADEGRLGDIALARRIDLQLALAEYQVREQQLRLAVLEQYPDVAVGPALNFSSMQTLLGGAWRVELPVFYQNQGAIQAAQAGRDAAAAMLDETVLDAAHEIREALRWMEHYRAQRARLIQEELPSLRSRYDAAMARLALDPTTVPPAMDAFRELAERTLEIREYELEWTRASQRLARAVAMPLRAVHTSEKVKRNE